MNIKVDIQYKTVFETTNTIMAATVQEDLKRAGFEAMLNDCGDGEFHVVVPQDQHAHAKALLITNPKYEIFTVPKE